MMLMSQMIAKEVKKKENLIKLRLNDEKWNINKRVSNDMSFND